jgi:hypothetical protein
MWWIVAAMLLWIVVGAVVANFTWPRWIGLPYWWAALVWPLTFRRNP